LIQSGHDFLRRICPLLTQSGHWSANSLRCEAQLSMC
jgi:hypothetical protein